jgi:hypothetical protein
MRLQGSRQGLPAAGIPLRLRGPSARTELCPAFLRPGARRVLTWCCCPPSQTYAWPETVRPEACGWACKSSRSRRSLPSTRSPVTHGAGAPAVKARADICWASWGLVATPSSSGRPACWQGVAAGPLLGQRALTVQQRVPQRTGIAQQPPALAVVHLDGRPTLLARYAGCVVPSRQQAGLIAHQYGV